MDTPPAHPRRKALVLGASSGIGRSIALALAEHGTDLVVVGRRAALLDEVVAKAGSGTALAADLSDAASCERVAADAVEALGGSVDAVVHAVGMSPLARISDTSGQSWQEVFATNVVGPSLVTGAVLPSLADGGLVAFLSSRSVGRPYHGVGAYAAAKAALDQTILSWRLEHPEHRFSRIEVGDTLGTDFSRDFDAALIGELFPLWVAHATMPQNFMDCDQVGAAIAAHIRASLDQPGIAVNELVMHPPGGPRTQSADELLALRESAH
ncbi:SDR family oxidoreductase [Yinghuangia sp. YIM S09857]|uniref:SDR family oxidoreductase n=1 Tax=Yinghuangia sp. YIM S09857 TaxID=3436929 RepID=UPI003F5359FA